MKNLRTHKKSLCAQLCSGNYQYIIETDRFNGLPKDKMLRLLCVLGKIKNEVHFVFYCSECGYLRAACFSKISSISK